MQVSTARSLVMAEGPGLPDPLLCCPQHGCHAKGSSLRSQGGPGSVCHSLLTPRESERTHSYPCHMRPYPESGEDSGPLWTEDRCQANAGSH